MAEFDNTNRWTLFKNDRKEKDTHPDYTGKLNVDGVEYYLSAWLKEGNGKKFFSGNIKPVEEKAKPKKAKPVDDDFEDDIPF
jgi:hypothetical protein